jgi:hypothetical protein
MESRCSKRGLPLLVKPTMKTTFDLPTSVRSRNHVRTYRTSDQVFAEPRAGILPQSDKRYGMPRHVGLLSDENMDGLKNGCPNRPGGHFGRALLTPSTNVLVRFNSRAPVVTSDCAAIACVQPAAESFPIRGAVLAALTRVVHLCIRRGAERAAPTNKSDNHMNNNEGVTKKLLLAAAILVVHTGALNATSIPINLGPTRVTPFFDTSFNELNGVSLNSQSLSRFCIHG